MKKRRKSKQSAMPAFVFWLVVLIGIGTYAAYSQHNSTTQPEETREHYCRRVSMPSSEHGSTAMPPPGTQEEAYARCMADAHASPTPDSRKVQVHQPQTDSRTVRVR